MNQAKKAFDAINKTHASRRKDISHLTDKKFYEGKYTVAEKRCFILRSYVKAYDRRRDTSFGDSLFCRVYLTASTPLHVIMSSLLGNEDGSRPETMEVNEAMSIARLAIMAMDAEDEQK
jgi:hypothetical protein